MNDINYIGFTSKNGEPWDKLKQENFKKDKTFTTFRGYGPKKDKYYENNINNIFIVSLDRRQIGKAQLLKKNISGLMRYHLKLYRKIHSKFY